MLCGIWEFELQASYLRKVNFAKESAPAKNYVIFCFPPSWVLAWFFYVADSSGCCLWPLNFSRSRNLMGSPLPVLSMGIGLLHLVPIPPSHLQRDGWQLVQGGQTFLNSELDFYGSPKNLWSTYITILTVLLRWFLHVNQLCLSVTLP